MIDQLTLHIVLGFMGFVVLVCVVRVMSLWSDGSDPDRPDDIDSTGLRRLAASFQAEKDGMPQMNFEDALLLAVRVRNTLTVGYLLFAGFVVLCATVITCFAIKGK